MSWMFSKVEACSTKLHALLNLYSVKQTIKQMHVKNDRLIV